MLPFVVLLFVPMLIQHVVINKRYAIDHEKKNKIAITFFFIVLTVLLVLRHESVGNDTRNYGVYFERYAQADWRALLAMPLEVGYLIFNKLISFVSQEPRFFQAVSAIVISVMIYPTYRRLCEDASLTVMVFCTLSTFVMMFSGIRQMLAVGVGFIAYEFTRRKKLFSFALAVCMALTFHTSAFMLIFMYPLYHAKITKKWLYAVVPALLVIFVFNRPIFSVLTMLIERYTNYAGDMISTGAYTMLILFSIFTVFSFVIPDEKRMDNETIGLRNFLLLSLVVQMFAPLHNLAMRMNYYYIIFIPLLIPKIIAIRNKRWEQVAVLGRHVMVVFFFVYFFLNALRGGNLNVFPYHFFWENVG